MIKKALSCLGAMTLICFSFYYTDSAVNIVKRNDPIMKEILNVSPRYFEEAVDATLVGNQIIPGESGIQVSVDESYEKMKRLGEFDKTLLVFEEIIPSVSIHDNYDHFIISGNSNKKMVALVFKVRNTSYMEEIMSILNYKNVHATFFVNNEVFDNGFDLVKLMAMNKYGVSSLETDVSSLIKHQNMLKNAGIDFLPYCFVEKEDYEALEQCEKEKMHTILPTINTDIFPYNEVKNNLENGAIIAFDNNRQTLRELKSTINYILQKGYRITTLKNLLQE